MQYSILKKSVCSKYDFGHFLLSPTFFLKDKLTNWETLDKKSSQVTTDYFLHIQDTRKEINEKSICYDLTDGLPKFFDGGIEVDEIGSTKKIAQQGDFLISRMRSYLQEMGIVEQKPKEQLFSPEFLIFRQKTDNISSYTLFALCMTKNVQTILKLGQYGTEHPRFYNFLLTELPIPDYLLKIDSSIKRTIQHALNIRVSSRAFYKQAQDMLLAELGLEGWQPKHKLCFRKKYADAIEAGRFDADYFQPKYGKTIKDIKKYRDGWDTLGNLCELVGHPSNPPYADTNDKNKTFIVAQKHLGQYSLNDNYWASDDAKHTTAEFIANNKQYILKNDDLVLYTVGAPPHIGKANIIFETKKPATIGSFVTLVRANKMKINPFYLLVFFNSPIGYFLTNRFQRGMVQQYIYPKDLIQTVIPILPKKKQERIQEKVVESFKLREQSKQLLECAKRAVEIAIEKNEKVALKYLEEKTKEISA